jgi:hypothetical protein
MSNPTPDEQSETTLEEAYRLTHGPRRADYGHPLDDYTRTAALWSAMLAHKLREPITPEEAALCMVQVKLSRHMNAPKRDNMVDAAGYTWVAWECTEERERRVKAMLNSANDYPRMGSHAHIAPVGTVAPMEFQDPPPPNAFISIRLPGESQFPAPTVDIPMPAVQPLRVATTGRILACGCFGSCTGQTPNCPNWIAKTF